MNHDPLIDAMTDEMIEQRSYGHHAYMLAGAYGPDEFEDAFAEFYDTVGPNRERSVARDLFLKAWVAYWRNWEHECGSAA